jgi:phosphopentomutase
MKEVKRVILIVLDGVGIGALPDAEEFGDSGSNTLKHVAEHLGGIHMPNMQRLGLGNILPIKGVSPVRQPEASHGLMMSMAKGKDSFVGHQELMGYIIKELPIVFPNGFPGKIIQEFCKTTGVKAVLGNKALPTPFVIKELGETHMKTGLPILNASASCSVFHIAAHEEVISPEKLYEMCKKARIICDRYGIHRVIAHPFRGVAGNFILPKYRKNYSLRPNDNNTLDILKANNLPIVGIGKIDEIFSGRGTIRAIQTNSNDQGMGCLLEELSITKKGLIFVNLLDFDIIGHLNNIKEYGGALEHFDKMLGKLLPKLEKEDLLIITSDHGCDPTYPGNDHTREYVPLLMFSKNLLPYHLGIRKTFADVGATILSLFGFPYTFPGNSII